MTDAGKPWVVHKFGGTSVADASRYREAGRIVRQAITRAPDRRMAVVVSAMKGVTDALIELTQLAQKRSESYTERLVALKQRHEKAARELLPTSLHSAICAAFERDFSDIREVLRGIWHVQSCPRQSVELVSGYGEVWSAQLLAAHLSASDAAGGRVAWLDARKVLCVEPSDTVPPICWDLSRERMAGWLAENTSAPIVITGFVASTPEGVPTTLKRNGSDYSASIFGALLAAAEIVIWTDVDGVLSADPRRVPDAVVLGELSYDEATELAYFGAKVVHPSTMAPAIANRIPIWIRNTFNPGHPGTKIHASPAYPENDARPVKGFATIDAIALVNVEGTGMIGVPGVAQRLFGALREVGISVVMISQASSEHSICVAVPEAQGKLARETIERAFFAEIHHGQVEAVRLTPACSILAAVGDRMANLPGVSGKFLGALGRAGINIRAIAQGASERNISVAIDRADATRALRAVHSGFFLSNQTISIGLIGPGLIGGTLLAQLEREAAKLRRDLRIDLRVRGIMDSKRMLLSDSQIELAGWRERLGAGGAAQQDLDAFAGHVGADHLPHAALIDCTSSSAIAERYAGWLKQGFHLITPNKKAGSGPLAAYHELKRLSREHLRHYLYETTVGAGLPILNTLRELVRTGDRVISVEGVLSGTLSFLFASLDPQIPFSGIVREAKTKGFTEPDPRDDLSGLDVARKLVILAREMSLSVELSQVEVESQVPDPLLNASAEEFMARLSEYDAPMAKLAAEAAAANEVLRYVGVIETLPAPRCRVGLKRYPKTHPFATMGGGENIVAFRTARYDEHPLIVRGPGAGPEVTAAGVFADLLRLASYLGAPL